MRRHRSKPEASGQHDVEQDAVDVAVVDRGDGLAGVRRGDHPEPLVGEEVREQADDLGFVLDQEHGLHARQCPAAVEAAWPIFPRMFIVVSAAGHVAPV